MDGEAGGVCISMRGRWTIAESVGKGNDVDLNRGSCIVVGDERTLLLCRG
jgi:hypothetical protein